MFFKGLANMSGDEALELLVGLRTYQLSRMLRIRGEEKIHGLKEDVFSLVGQLMSRFDDRITRQIEDTRHRIDWNVATMDQIAQEERARLAGLDPAEIKKQLRQEISLTAGERASSDEETIERKVVSEVASAFGIDTAFRTLDAVENDIFLRFLRDLAERIQAQISQMKAEEVSAVEERLFENLSRLNDRDRDALKRDLGLAELSERQLLNVVRSEGPALVSRMGEDGYGIYVALTTATHAVFSTMMGVVLPFSFYSAMATLGGFLLGPLGFALITVGGGSYLYKKAQKEYNAQLLAFAMGALMVKQKWAND